MSNLVFLGAIGIMAITFLAFCYRGFARTKNAWKKQANKSVHPLSQNSSSDSSERSGRSISFWLLAPVLFAVAAYGQTQPGSTSSNADATSSSATQSLPAAPAPAATGTAADNAGFFTRLGRAYVADWSGHAQTTQATSQDRRGTPAPLSSPPFPASDWPIGGTPVIGASDGSSYPLMQAINQNKSRYKIYGWMEVGANGSTNNRGNASKGIPANWPSAYDEYPNTIQLDQAALYYERYPDTVQKDHFDWGWRFTALYGVDYRFTTAKGMLSQQLLVKNAQYGFDPVMFYTDLYFPKVADGMNIRIGRYISLPDIEAQLAPNNYTYSHSILYTFDCYTQTGVNATVKLNNHWTAQAGLSPGCDVMPWTTDAKVTGNTCLQYSWHNGGDALYTCANSINDGKYAYNNLSAYYETWYHKINAHWHTDTEGWYQYMRDTPNMYWYNGTDPTTGIQYANTAATPWPEAQNYIPGQRSSYPELRCSLRRPKIVRVGPTRPLLRSRMGHHQLSWSTTLCTIRRR